MKKNVLAVLIMAMILLSVGCSASKVESASDESTGISSTVENEQSLKDSIVYALWSSPDGFFNPALSNTTYDGAVNDLLYDSLIDYDKNMNIVASMAKSFDVSKDKKTLIFDLRDDITWHDGKKVSVDDVIFTLESLADANYTGAYSNIVEGIDGYEEYNSGKENYIKGIKINNKKISITLKDVYAPALMNIGQFGILPKHIWSTIPIEDWESASELLAMPIGSGPYKFIEFVDGHHLKLQANESYYKGNVKTKNFIFKITNRDNLHVQLENGEVDIADVSDMKNVDIDKLESNGMMTVSFPNNLIQYMGFNLRDERFQDVKVRAAFMHSLDRALMLDALVGGKGKLVNTPMIPTSWAYPSEESLNSYDYDIEKAKLLFREAGWEDRDQDGVLEDESGNNFEVLLTYPSGDKSREASAPIIQDYMKKVGIDMKLEMLEFKATMKKVVADHEFDLYLMGNSLDSDPNPKPYWHSSAMSNEKGVYAWNIAGFANEKADLLMEAGLATVNQEERKKIYNDFGILMNNELPWLTLYCKDITMAYNPKLINYSPSTYTKFVEVENWEYEK